MNHFIIKYKPHRQSRENLKINIENQTQRTKHNYVFLRDKLSYAFKEFYLSFHKETIKYMLLHYLRSVREIINITYIKYWYKCLVEKILIDPS